MPGGIQDEISTPWAAGSWGYAGLGVIIAYLFPPIPRPSLFFIGSCQRRCFQPQGGAGQGLGDRPGEARPAGPPPDQPDRPGPRPLEQRQPEPEPVAGIELILAQFTPIKAVWCASSDDGGEPRPLAFEPTADGKPYVRIAVPELRVWTMVWVEE